MNKTNSDNNVHVFISESKLIPCLLWFDLLSPVCTGSAYTIYFIKIISIKIYATFRRLSALNLICLLCHSWEIKDSNNQGRRTSYMKKGLKRTVFLCQDALRQIHSFLHLC